MPGNPLVRFDEGRVGRTASVALSPTLPANTVFATSNGLISPGAGEDNANSVQRTCTTSAFPRRRCHSH